MAPLGQSMSQMAHVTILKCAFGDKKAHFENSGGFKKIDSPIFSFFYDLSSG
jgi:hypothetical protein